MAWTPKAAAPAYFSLADAFLALVTGDPTWGWLVDWLTLIPNTGQSTAEFCAEGPIFTSALGPADFFPTFNPLDPRRAIQTTAMGVRIAAAARDRVFGAYCEQAAVGATGPIVYDAPVCFEVSTDGQGADVRLLTAVPPGRNWIRLSSPDCPANQSRMLHAWQGVDTGPTLSNIGGFAGTGPATLVSGTFYPINLYYYLYGTTGYSCSLCVEYGTDGASDPVSYTPTPQPQPDGVVSPLTTVDPSLAGIAAEASRLEFKLDTIWALLQSIAGSTLDLGGPVLEPTSVAADEVVAVADAVGVVVTVSNPPASLSLDFGVPQEIIRMAHLNFGTADAWFPSVWITHTPFVVRPLPQGTTRVSVTRLVPGASAELSFISPLK